MTLIVSAYVRVDNEKITEISLDSDLAGFESTRNSFYGNPEFREKIPLLSQLKDVSMIEVSGRDLYMLIQEVNFLLNSLPNGEDGDYWRFRLRNILNAINSVLEFGENGCVSIG